MVQRNLAYTVAEAFSASRHHHRGGWRTEQTGRIAWQLSGLVYR
jgi:hypothetical protein